MEYWQSDEGFQRLWPLWEAIGASWPPERRFGPGKAAFSWYIQYDGFVRQMDAKTCFGCLWVGRVERCHLRAHACGGTSYEDNLVLLCPGCHRDAPDTSDPELMLAWILRREPYWVEQLAHIGREMRQEGIDPDTLGRLKAAGVDLEDLSAWAAAEAAKVESVAHGDWRSFASLTIQITARRVRELDVGAAA